MQVKRLKLLCLPCAGASATMYLRWKRRLPAWIEVHPVELPGRGERLSEPFTDDFEAQVVRLCEEQATRLRGDFALFGHSMGALLAYGMAVRLRDVGRPQPQMLFVSGSAAPSIRDPERLAGLDNDEALIADLRRQGGTPEEVFESPELLRLTLDALAADYRLCRRFRYRGGPPLDYPLQAFAGHDDDIERERLEAWRRETGGAFSLDWLEGGHFFIRHQEGKVLATIERALARRLEEEPHAAPAAS
ncbi:thioesterase II family protein [Chromohalobacter nigrandesensis]|uniref:thioesterase II family protein n=1 Tax=Chromohalobacter nigrandesensis TaxID=119863 RepID=UPI001FF4A64F|nr:alpha/beta fold hydrolase [Chromohalobacter nigrandesensis]MCK0745721.1 alpha/beta fold hydrolase [Chromohalobacter nigrandesensis]